MADLAKTIRETDLPRVIVEVQTSSLAGRRFAFTSAQLKQGILIGRAPNAGLRFDPNRDLKVSSKHAFLKETKEGVFVHDEGSSNGVYINGRRVKPEGDRVYHDDIVSLGQEGALLRMLVPGEAPSRVPATREVKPEQLEDRPAPASIQDRPVPPSIRERAVPAPAPAPGPTKLVEVARRVETTSRRRKGNKQTLMVALAMLAVAVVVILINHFTG